MFLSKFRVLLGRIDAAYHSVNAFLDLLEFVRGQIAVLCRLQQNVAPQEYEALLDGLLMLEETWQEYGAEILLDLNGLRDGQHVLVMCEMQFPTGLLIFIPHIIQLATTSTRCCKCKQMRFNF